MIRKLLFIGGEQDKMYNRVADKVETMKLKVYRPVDFKNIVGIVTLGDRYLRTEVYHRRVIAGVECFQLEEVINEK